MDQEQQQKKVKKMTGLGFYFILMIVSVDDIVDIILTLTGVGSPVASGISIAIAGLVWVYLWIVGVGLNDRTAIRGAISFLIELIPGLGALPMGVLFLISTRLYENNDKFRKLVGTVSQAKGGKVAASKPTDNITRETKKPPQIEKPNPNTIRTARSNNPARQNPRQQTPDNKDIALLS